MFLTGFLRFKKEYINQGVFIQIQMRIKKGVLAPFKIIVET
jgi:hypothetical protein